MIPTTNRVLEVVRTTFSMNFTAQAGYRCLPAIQVEEGISTEPLVSVGLWKIYSALRRRSQTNETGIGGVEN